jgi:hypothetical protein
MWQTRNRIIALAVAALLPVVGTRATWASLIVYDDFNQPAGGNLGGTMPSIPNLNTSGTNRTWQAQTGTTDNQFSNPGLTFPASYANAPAVSGNAVTLTGNTSLSGNSSGNVDRIVINSSGSTFSSTGDLSTAYYSLLLNVPTNLAGIAPNTFTTQSSSGYGYNYALVAAFTDGNGATGGLGTQISGIYVRAGSAPNTFDVGIGGNRGGIAWSSDMTAGSTHFLVADFVSGSSDTSSLWIDPTLGQSSAPATLLTETGLQNGGFGDNAVDSFALASNLGLPTAGLTVDEVRVGTTFADVTPAGIVPEPSSLVTLLGAGAIGIAIAVRRGFRRA